ncbi:MAG: BatA domain-containing protein [Planctomycetota bacterium]
MSFLNGGLLWAGALIAVPIIIHLLNRRRFKVVRWAAMDFLLAAQKENRRRIRIEHLLVLLLRCLALLLLALLLARPAVSQRGLGFLPGVSESIERIVVLDDSGSMAYTTGRATSFARARRLVKQLVNDLVAQRPADYLTVVRAGAPDAADPRLASPRSEATERFLAGLDQLEPGQGVLDLPRALRAALGDDPPGSPGKAGAPGKAVVYVVTDLRHRDWIGERGDLPRRIADALRASGRAAEGALRLLVVDVGGEGARNLGVVGLRAVDKLAMAGLPFEVAVSIKNYGEQPVYEVPLTLETPDGRVPLQPLKAIEPGKTAEARVQTTFLQPGAQAVSVRLGEDALPLDDARHLALSVTEHLHALLIDGERLEGPLGGEAALLRMALAPPGDGESGVDPNVVLAEDAGAEELAGYDSLVLCNVARWPAERQEELERFVRKGGGLAVFLGDKVDLQAADQVLYRDGQGLLPVKLGDPVTVESEEQRPSLAPPGAHPLVKVFQGERNLLVTRVRARRYVRLELDPARDATSKVVLSLADAARTPFVVEKPFGRGRVVLWNTTADNDWANLPKNFGWPVVAQELVRLLAPEATQGLNLTCGEPLERPLDQARDQTRARLLVPGERRERELFAEQGDDGGTLRLRLQDTSRAGVYRLTLTSLRGQERQERVAINVDPSEGDLRRAQPEQVRAGLDGIPIEFVTGAEDQALLTVTDGTQTELWRSVLYALCALLLLEQVVAWVAAHHQPPRPQEAA